MSAGQASYTGEFKSGLMEGTGRLVHDDGQEYDGTFRAGLKHGSGKLVMVNGDTYEGAFVKDLMHGRGVLTLADGTQLRGCFNEGFLEGQGEQVSETDVAYVGEWKGGKFHGAGLLRTREGDTFDGKFSSGLPMGQGSWRLADGRSTPFDAMALRDDLSRNVDRGTVERRQLAGCWPHSFRSSFHALVWPCLNCWAGVRLHNLPRRVPLRRQHEGVRPHV